MKLHIYNDAFLQKKIMNTKRKENREDVSI